MVDDNSDIFGTQFTVSIDHVDTTTGIRRLRTYIDCQKSSLIQVVEAKDFNRPSHLFSISAQDKGVLARNGHTGSGC